MKNLVGGLLALGLGSVTIISALTMSSCRDKFTTQYDTLVKTDTANMWPLASGWTIPNSPTMTTLVIGQFVNSNTGFAAGSQGVVIGTGNSGNDWKPRNPAPVFNSSAGPGAIYGISFFDAANGIVVGDQRDISLTTDGGNSWNPMDASNVPTTDLIRSVCFTNRNIGFIGTTDAYAAQSGYICGTVDGGQTWNPILNTNGGIYYIDFSIPGSNGMIGAAIGRFGVAYWTNNSGSTWTQGTTDQPNALVSRSTFTTATTGFASAVSLADTTHGYILRTDDAGHTWKTVKSVSLGLCGIASNGNGSITAVGYGGAIVESTDGGTTWNQGVFLGTFQGRWLDVRYATQHRAVLFGVNGDIATRDK